MLKFISFILFFTSTAISAQGTYDFLGLENRLKDTALLINRAETDDIRLNSAEYLWKELAKGLEEQEAFNYPFDSLRSRTVSIISSEDMKFRIYTFNAVLKNGKFIHYGILHYKINKREYGIELMKDTTTAFNKQVLDDQLLPDEWFGALYYKVRAIKHWCRKTKYILLGFDGADAAINRKVIDVLTFTKEGPVFGYEMFREGVWDPDFEYRVVMEANGEVYQTVRFLDFGKRQTL